MNSIESLLRSFPETLGISELAEIIACTRAEAEQIVHDGVITGHENDGVWTISKQSLSAQLEALRTPANAA